MLGMFALVVVHLLVAVASDASAAHPGRQAGGVPPL